MKKPECLATWRGKHIDPESEDDIHGFDSETDALARTRAHESTEARITPPPTVQKGDDSSLFGGSTMAFEIDFQSEDGFKQAGKKGKKASKAAAKSKWDDDEGDTAKKEEGEGEGEGGDGGDKGGDTGAGGDGDKKDDANGAGDGAGEGPPDDTWDSVVPAKKTKKSKKAKAEEAKAEEAKAEGAKAEEAALEVPAADKLDAFSEIKLDDTGPMLDLSFDTGTKTSTGGFGSWGSSWITGGSKIGTKRYLRPQERSSTCWVTAICY